MTNGLKTEEPAKKKKLLMAAQQADKRKNKTKSESEVAYALRVGHTTKRHSRVKAAAEVHRKTDRKGSKGWRVGAACEEVWVQ